MGRATTRGTRLTSERGLQIFEIFCTRCHCDLGTMDSKAILEAIYVKGELMCPECRSNLCNRCGHEMVGGAHLFICRFCEWEIETVNEGGEELRLSSISNLNKAPNGIDKSGVE